MGGKVFTTAAILFLAGAVWAGDLSLQDVEPVPTDYTEFWYDEEWLLKNFYYVGLEIAFFEYTRAIETHLIMFSKEGIEASVPQRARGKFSNSLSAFDRMWNDIENVKKEKAVVDSLLTTWVLFLPFEFELGDGVHFELQIPGLPSLISRVRSALHSLTRALVHGGVAVNSAFAVLEEDFRQLDRMGADSVNYSGKAKPAYAKVGDIITLAHIDMPEGRYDDFARAHASARGLAKRIQALYVRIPSGSEFAALPIYDDAINAFGEAFLAAVRLHEELSDAIEAMEGEYREKEMDVSSAFARMSRRLRMMEEERYELIDERVVRFFLQPSERASATLPTPKESLASAAWLFEEARGEASDAGRLHSSPSIEDYVALAIAKLDVAALRLKQAERVAGEAEELASRLATNAAALVERERATTREAIADFQPTSQAEADNKANASALLAEAESQIERARSARLGERLASYMQAVLKLRMARAEVGRSAVLTASAREDAESAVAELERIASLAEKDGLDVSAEKEFISTARALIPLVEPVRLADIIAQANSMREALLAQSGRMFGGLNERWLALRSLLARLAEQLVESGLEGYQRELLDMEARYFSDGRFDLRKAMGHYHEIRRELEAIELAVDRQKATALAAYLKAHAQETILFDETPAVGKPTQLTVVVEIENGLEIGHDGLLRIEVPVSIPLGRPAEKSPEISDVAYANGKLTIAFATVAPGGRYRVLFRERTALATDGGSSESVESVSQYALRKRAVQRFDALMELPALRLERALATSPLYFEAFHNGMEAKASVVADDGVRGEVVLERVRKGRGEVVLRYAYANPYTVSRRNYNVIQTQGGVRVLFETVVDSAFELDSAPVQVLEPANASVLATSAVVLGLGECAPKNIRAQNTAVGFILSWDAGALRKGERCVFAVAYEIGNLQAYAQAKADALAGAVGNFSQYASRLREAQALIGQGKYAEAAVRLEELERALANASISPSRSAVERQLARLREERAKLNESRGILAEGGRLGEALVIEGMLQESEADEALARSYLEQGKYELAARNAARALAKLDAEAVQRGLLSWRNEIGRMLANVKSALAALKPLADLPDARAEAERAEALIEDAGRQMAAREWAMAARALRDAEAAASGAMRSVKVTAEGIYDDTVAQREAFEGIRRAFAEAVSGLERALKVTVDISRYKSGRLSAGFDAPVAKAHGNTDERTLEYFFQHMGANKTKFVLENALAIKNARETLARLNTTRERFEDELTSLRRRAQASLNAALTAIDELERRADNEQAQKEAIYLRSQAKIAKEALSDGRYSDASMIASYILERARSQLPATQAAPGLALSTETWIAAVSLVILAVLAYLFLSGNRPAEPEHRVLRRKGEL
ncbi:MAG: hypothetical protein QXG98_05345 [Candidatus Micrarchaeia archaeon]